MSAAETLRPAPAGQRPVPAGAPERGAPPHVPFMVGLLHGCLVLCIIGSAAAHGWMAIGGGHGAGWSLVMAGMALACSFCVVDLLRRRHDLAPVRMALGMAAAMAMIHVLMVPLMATGGAGAQHAHHGGGGTGAESASIGGADHSTMFLMIAVELVTAGLAAAQLRRQAEKGAKYLR